MAQNTATKPEDVVLNFLYKWGGIGIIGVVTFLIIAYIFSIAVSLMINTMNALENVAGTIGLIAISAFVGAAVGIAIYVYVKKRVAP